MGETKYVVEMDGLVVARDMDITIAALLVKALSENYCQSMQYGSKIVVHVDENTAVNERNEEIDKKNCLAAQK